MNLHTLRAVVDCLIPPDDYPGAFDAGVCDFIARLLETDLAEQRGFVAAGLEGIETESLARFAISFTDLSSDHKILILKAVESANVVAPWTIAPDQFFEILVTTTAEGYYSDPEQGGNRGATSWVMTGFQEGLIDE